MNQMKLSELKNEIIKGKSSVNELTCRMKETEGEWPSRKRVVEMTEKHWQRKQTRSWEEQLQEAVDLTTASLGSMRRSDHCIPRKHEEVWPLHPWSFRGDIKRLEESRAKRATLRRRHRILWKAHRGISYDSFITSVCLSVYAFALGDCATVYL